MAKNKSMRRSYEERGAKQEDYEEDLTEDGDDVDEHGVLSSQAFCEVGQGDRGLKRKSGAVENSTELEQKSSGNEKELSSHILPVASSEKEEKPIVIAPVPLNFTETQEEDIARWIEGKRMLYDIKDRRYSDKSERRHLWEEKAKEYGVDHDTMLKWYHTQRTRFAKLKQGQPKKKWRKRLGDGLSSGNDEESYVVEEISENDTDRDKFIRKIFGFLKPHIRRHKKNTPVRCRKKLSIAETGELAGDDSTGACGFANQPKGSSNTYCGYPADRPPSRAASEDQPGPTGSDMNPPFHLQDNLVQYISSEPKTTRATPFCKYLETELEFLHEACKEPAFEDMTTVLNYYRKMSRRLRGREAGGVVISPYEVVPSAFPVPW